MRPICNKTWFKKVKTFLIADYDQKRCRTSNYRYLFWDFSREIRIGARGKYSGNQERPELKNSREFRNEAKEILVGKTGMKNKDSIWEKQNRRKRVKCQTG